MGHLWAMPQHFEEWIGYGLFFLLAAFIQGAYALVLLRWTSRPILLAGIAGNLGMVGFYIGSRTAGIPLLGPHAGHVESVAAVDLTVTIAELALVGTLVVLARVLHAARTYVILGVVQAFGIGALLDLMHGGLHASVGASPVQHWLSNSILALPLSVLVVWLATPLARRLVRFFGGETGSVPSRLAWSLVAAGAYAGASIPANGLAVQHAEAGPFFAQALRDAGVVLGATFLLLFAISMLRGAPWEEPKKIKINLWRPRAVAAAAGMAVALAVVAGPTVFGQSLSKMASAQQAHVQQAPAASECSAASYDRSYDVAAINLDIPYNRWGNVDPHGVAYVLQGDKKAVKNWHVKLGDTPETDPAEAGNRRLRPRPLVLRANEGECVKVDFTNELQDEGEDGLPNNPRASMKVFGPSYDVQTSDGAAAGFNEDTTVSNDPGENKITYFWKAPDAEGNYLFRDAGATAGSEANSGSLSHGLYGSLAVEPGGSQWLDPTTGDPLYEGAKDHSRITKESGDPYIDATIVPPGEEAFRETIQNSQDELPGGNGFAFNYGAEPDFNRVASNPAGEGELAGEIAPDAIGEETALSSWTFGDPSLIKLASGQGPWLPEGNRKNKEDCGLEESCYTSNVVHAYPKDPTKIRFIHAGVKETHVFHLHANQWRVEPNDPNSTIIDSQTYGPGEGFSAELIGGAGSKPGTVGDAIFHCHLYPHFADGFWALLRTHDVTEDGTNKLPDGTNVRSLKPLPDRVDTAQPKATADKPGYPRFIPGESGWRAPQPPKGISESNGNQDDPATIEREDLKAATRVVAGRPLDPATLDAADPVEKRLADKLKTEENTMAPGSNPGAPFKEPCPSGSREITYNVAAIQTDITYNERGDHDTQARIFVPAEDAKAILAGEKEPEPLFIRANAGDCINFNLTNYLPNWFGGDAFTKLAQTNMTGAHIHLVKFDVLASDGSSNGWNYQQAAFSKEQDEFNKDLDANGNVKNCNWNSCRVGDPATWDPAQKSSVAAPGQTIHERWYADTQLRTSFFHDHHFAALDQNRGYFGALIAEAKNLDFRSPEPTASGGEKYFQPIDDPANGTPCGNSCNATASGTAMDVIGPGPNDDFREFGLAVQDFVSLTKKGGDPTSASDTIGAPGAPEKFPDDDPGTMGINYKNAPFQLRQERDGTKTDPAYAFSSTVHGDPATPILETYSEDPVRIRAIQGSQEEQHVLAMNGMRWRDEPDDPNSPLVNSKAIGVSEAFNFEVPKIECGAGESDCSGDYLYSGTSTDDLYQGVWGLLRARGNEVPSLLPLPDNVPATQGIEERAPSATAPPKANSPGTPCAPGAPTKQFSVVAMQADIKYNKDGDHDPRGLIYALASDEDAIRSGKKEPTPLTLRANEGDCIEVRLTNKIPKSWLDEHGNAGTNGDPEVPTEPEQGTPAGLRVSLHPQLVKYDVRGSDGTAVGYNRDQTVGPGESTLYRWYADDVSSGEIGTTNLTDFGDVRGHRHHGLFAGLNIEPKGSKYHDPKTGAEIKSGDSADIRVPGPNNDFREFTTFFQDGLNLQDASNNTIEDPLDHPPTPDEPLGEGMDAEDQGEKGFNYGNAPFSHRINDPLIGAPNGEEMANVFNSKVHGDPDTPIFRAYPGDDVRMRLLQGADKPRQNSYQLSGHSWLAQPNDPNSNVIGNQGGISVDRTFNIHLPNAGSPGDHMYSTGAGFHNLAGGLWGLMRVYPEPTQGILNPTPIGATDDPMAGGHPLMPLETDATSPVKAGSSLTLEAGTGTIDFGKTTKLNGTLTADDKPLADKEVTLIERAIGERKYSNVPGGTLTTNAQGEFSKQIKPRKNTYYRVRFSGDAASEASTGGAERVNVRADVSLNVLKDRLPRGERIGMVGVVRPAHAGDEVKLIIKRGSQRVQTKTVILDEKSRYRFVYSPKRVGNYNVKAILPKQDADHLGNSSQLERFKVTRR
jgi:hypothetical protein